MVYFGNTPVKIEKITNHPSLLKTDLNLFTEKEQNDLKNELNKKKVYLLTTQESEKKQLLLIQPETRLASKKSITSNRHQTFIIKVKTEKASRNFKESHKKRLDFNLPKLKKNKHGLVTATRPFSFKYYEPLKTIKSTEVSKKFSKHGRQYFRRNRLYFSPKQKNSKAICPVFFDKLSAEEFLIQTCEFSTFEKTMNSKKSILKCYHHLLKLKNAANQEFLEKLTSFQEQFDLYNLKLSQLETEEIEIKQNSALIFFKKHVIKTCIKQLKELYVEEIIRDIYRNIYFRTTFQNYEDTFESVKLLAKKIKVPKQAKQVGKTKLICVGLGDLISSYSSLPKINDLKNFEFLFFPETQEKLNFINEKTLMSAFSKKLNFVKKEKNSAKKIPTSKLRSNTFKDYQKKFFEDL